MSKTATILIILGIFILLYLISFVLTFCIIYFLIKSSIKENNEINLKDSENKKELIKSIFSYNEFILVSLLVLILFYSIFSISLNSFASDHEIKTVSYYDEVLATDYRGEKFYIIENENDYNNDYNKKIINLKENGLMDLAEYKINIIEIDSKEDAYIEKVEITSSIDFINHFYDLTKDSDYENIEYNLYVSNEEPLSSFDLSIENNRWKNIDKIVFNGEELDNPYDIKVTENGDYVLEIYDIQGPKTSETISINNISKESPNFNNIDSTLDEDN